MLGGVAVEVRLGPGWAALALAGLLVTAVPTASSAIDIQVEHATEKAVYLSSGSAEGVTVGDRLEVLRAGRLVALVEAVEVTAYGAFCRVVHQFLPIEPGDEVVSVASESITVAEAAPPAVRQEPEPVPELPPVLPEPPRPREPRPERTFRLSGSTFFRVQSRELQTDEPRRWDESTARISLRARDMLNRPLELRVRGRTRQRSRNFGDAGTESEQRFYEMSLSWAPDDSRSWIQAGRLGSRPEVGIGFLDGVAGQVGLGRWFGVGGFAGLDPEVDDPLFSTDHTKAGAFVTLTSPELPSGRYAEVLLSGIGEYAAGGVVSREYLYMQSRFGSRSRWSLYQQAELDVNRGWRRQLSGSSTQLSNLSVSGSYRFSQRFRGSLSYDARRRFRDFENRELPEDRFDRLLRDGVRASLFYRTRGGLAASLGLGVRGGQGDTATIRTYNGSISHANLLGWGLFAGVDGTVFQGDTTDGHLVTARLRKYLPGGHDVGLAYGASHSVSLLSASATDLSWLRLDGTVQLPRRLFLLAEIEYTLAVEDELRQLLQLGYRF